MANDLKTRNGPTLRTGGMLDDIPVIDNLNAGDLDLGKHYRFWFQGAGNALSQRWLVPVSVVRGSKPGPVLGLQALVHGDEVNGVRVLQKLLADIKPDELSGTLVVVHIANMTGLLANNRHWSVQTDGGTGYDFNRFWPGKEHGNAAEQQIHRLFAHVLANNADMVVDLHAQSNGTAYPLMLYADYRDAASKVLAELIPADQIKIDEGEPGAAEQAFLEVGIPSITLEVGAPAVYQQDLIDRAVTGILNVMIHHKMLERPLGPTSKTVGTFVGTTWDSIRALVSGFTDIAVTIGEDVRKGQLLAVQRNAFGDVMKEYHAPNPGKVISVATHPVREAGALLVRVMFMQEK